MRRALLAGSVTLGAALLPVCLIVSGVSLFPAPQVAAPVAPVVLPADDVASPGNPQADSRAAAGTDIIVVRLAAGVADPIQAATTAVQDAAAGQAGVKAARLIGGDTVSVTLDTRLSTSAADKVAKAATRHASVAAADRSITFEPAGTTAQNWQWNLANPSTGKYGVDAAQAWKTATGKGVVVGVVDTGIAPNAALPATTMTKVTRPVKGTWLTGQSVVGTTAAGAAVTVTAAGRTAPLCTTTANTAGAFTCTPLTPRPADKVELTVTATDSLGRTSFVKAVVGDASSPKPTMKPSNGKQIAGTAEPGATVALTYRRGTSVIGTQTVTAGSTGAWLVQPSLAKPPVTLGHGDTVVAVATDTVGNISDPSDVLTIDAEPPAAPVLNPTRGTTVTGTKEPGSYVTITWVWAGTDGKRQDSTLTLAPDLSKTWTTTLPHPAIDGTAITATATDPSGNTSAKGSAKADATKPAAPALNPTSGVTVTGKKEAGSYITIAWTDADGKNHTKKLGADNLETWTTTLSPAADDRSVITATATDASGNTSAKGSVTVDATPPPAPALDPTRGVTVTGKKEAGSYITIAWTDADGRSHTKTLAADAAKIWTTTLSPAADDRSVITATATDASGNTSGKGSVTVDATAPAAPALDPTRGVTVTGKKEAGSYITITWTDADGKNHTKKLAADNLETWTTTLDPAAVHRSTISATATDPTGNTSEAATTTAYANKPNAPVLDPSRGVTVTGTKDAGSSVTVTWTADGKPQTPVTVPADDTTIWTITLTGRADHRSTISATATDPIGQVSDAGKATVYAQAPATPKLEPSNGTTVSGTKEADTSVTLVWTHTDGTQRTTTVPTDSATSWSATLNSAKHGSVVTATAVYPTGQASTPATVTVDAEAPAPPKLDPTRGVIVSGTAEAGSRLTITWTGTDGENHTTRVEPDDRGAWTATLSPAAVHRSTISATATDPTGNTSKPGTVTVYATGPTAPQPEASDGVTVTGTKDADSSVTLTWTSKDGQETLTVPGDAANTWTATLTPAAVHGSTITAVATDPTGATSGPATTTVYAHAPATPTLQPTRGESVSGTKDADSSITLTWTDTDSNPHTKTLPADPGTSWTTTLSRAAAHGTTITAVATDPLGQRSAAAQVTVDSQAPGKPRLEPTRGATLSGTKEAGSYVTITWTSESGAKSTTLPADDQETWTTELEPAAVHRSIVSVTATDPAGNVSGLATTTVYADDPGTPKFEPSRGVTVTGTRDADTSVTLTWTSEQGEKTVTVPRDEATTWTATLDPAAVHGSTITAVATDPTGATSGPATTTVYAHTPATPTLQPTRGETVSGTRDADSSITLTWTDTDNDQHTKTLPADPSTSWTTSLETPAADGSEVTAVATDPTGSVSGQARVTVDATPPPTPVLEPTRGVTLSGTKEAGSYLTITWTSESGPQWRELGPDTGESWTVQLSPEALHGSTITVTATDATGNTSQPAAVTVYATPPATPALAPTDGVTLTGSKDAGSSVAVSWTSDQGPKAITLPGDEATTWTITLDPQAVDGSRIIATATDPTGATSPAGTVVADRTPPAGFVVSPSNGYSVTAFGVEPGARPEILDGAATRAGSWTGDDQGTWTFQPDVRLTEGGTYTIVVTDLTGNRSEPATVAVDTTPPSITIADVTQSAVSGSAETGALVSVTYQGVDRNVHSTDPVSAAGPSGNWGPVPLDPLATPGEELSAVATDAVSNRSEPVTRSVPVAEPEPTPDGSTPQPEPSQTPTPEGPTPQPESPSPSGDDQQVGAAAAGSGSVVTPAGSSTSGTVTSTSTSGTSVNRTNVVGTVLPGYDFIQKDADPTDADPTVASGDTAAYHGTHVAGIIAATGSDFWPAGVAPAVQIEPLRVLYARPNSTYSNSLDRIIEAINWASGTKVSGLPVNPNPVDVLNLSIQTQGATSCPSTLQAAIDAAVKKRVVVVAAAGNYTSSITTSAPANCKNVITVTASTSTGDRASASNWGTSATSSAWLVAAPGGSGSLAGCGDYNTLPSCTGAVVSTVSSSIQAKSGTSMAAPHVAGIAALLKQTRPGLTPAEIAKVIRGTATPMRDKCPTAVCGSGIADAAKAVAAVRDNKSVRVAAAVAPTVSRPTVTPSPKPPAAGGVAVSALLRASATSSYSTLTYQWLRDGREITGETGSSYRTVGADYRRKITVRVSSVGAATATSAPVEIRAKGGLSWAPPPAVTGTLKVKKILRATWGASPEQPSKVSYQWYRGSKKIKKATKATYKLTKSDRGKKIKVKVTVSMSGYYSASAYSSSFKIKR